MTTGKTKSPPPEPFYRGLEMRGWKIQRCKECGYAISSLVKASKWGIEEGPDLKQADKEARKKNICNNCRDKKL